MSTSVLELPVWAVVTAERREHIARVAALLGQWADAMRVTPVERGRWLRAAWLHDALRDAPLADELAHGPAAADRAARDGERDQGVLDAVRYHSVGYAGWDAVGRRLYCADYLEPGRRFDAAGRAALAARMPEDPEDVLRTVAARRRDWVIRSGWRPTPEMAAFWTSLAG
jgi:HD superfamily phosphohydrolase YqeK